MSLFSDKIFCLHGFDESKLNSLKLIIEQHGGTTTTEVSSMTSYLVTTPAEARFLSRTIIKTAIELGVPVVSEGFILQATTSRHIPALVCDSENGAYDINLKTPFVPLTVVGGKQLAGSFSSQNTPSTLSDNASLPSKGSLAYSSSNSYVQNEDIVLLGSPKLTFKQEGLLQRRNSSSSLKSSMSHQRMNVRFDEQTTDPQPRSLSPAILLSSRLPMPTSPKVANSSFTQRFSSDSDDPNSSTEGSGYFFRKGTDNQDDLGLPDTEELLVDNSEIAAKFMEEDELEQANEVPELAGIHGLVQRSVSTPGASDKPSPGIPSPYVPILGPVETRDRFEWQKLLTTYLTGEEFETEKLRESDLELDEAQRQQQFDIWLGVLARSHGRDPVDEQQWLEQSRWEGIKILEKVKTFRFVSMTGPTDYSDLETKNISDAVEKRRRREARCALVLEALTIVTALLDDVDFVESMYPSYLTMQLTNEIYTSQDFNEAYDALKAWCSICKSVNSMDMLVRQWLDLQDLSQPISPTFVERISKDIGLQNVFEGKTLSDLNALCLKTFDALESYRSKWIAMGLPIPKCKISMLFALPPRLMEECLHYRLKNAQQLHETSKVHGNNLEMHDQILADFRLNLQLATKTRITFRLVIEKYHHCASGVFEESEYELGHLFDDYLLKSLKFYVSVLEWKFRSGRQSLWFKAAEFLEQEWDFLKTVCHDFDDGEPLVAEQICLLTDRMFQTVIAYFQTGMRPPSNLGETGTIKWFTRLLENVRMRSRKMLNFMRNLSLEFENACDFVVHQPDLFLQTLEETRHVLVRVPHASFLKGVMVVASELAGQSPSLITKLLLGKRLDSETYPNMERLYILLCMPLNTTETTQWTSSEVTLQHFEPANEVEIDLKPGLTRLVAADSLCLPICRRSLVQVFADAKERLIKDPLRETHVGGIDLSKVNIFDLIRVQRALFAGVFRAHHRIRRTTVRFAEALLSAVAVIRQLTGSIQCVDLIENCFSFASDFGYRTVRFIGNSTTLVKLNRQLIDFAIEWVTFTCSDCSPTDRKTFRWAMMALEFVMLITRGNNILEITENEFVLLRSKVACCMTLLISHFDPQLSTPGTIGKTDAFGFGSQDDVNTADWSKLRDDMMQQLSSVTISPALPQRQSSEALISDDIRRLVAERQNTRLDQLLKLEQERDRRLNSVRPVGKVLDEQEPEDQTIIRLLASSSSNISMRWQQGQFVGSGTFGSVYVGINLDSGDLMAVKVIQFSDKNKVKEFIKSVRDEMSVLELLSHPNIVSYYGIEVHRDKCYIFMEYCSNGSLSSLLDNGPIEDDLIHQLYTVQLLNGLAYLHGQKILHRDIKPDNILFDQQCILKLVDFGAAKHLENRTKPDASKKSLAGTPSYMAPEVITGQTKDTPFGAQDIWSFACVVVQMITGKRPWSNLDNEWAIMYHIGVSHKHPPLPELRVEPLTEIMVPVVCTEDGLTNNCVTSTTNPSVSDLHSPQQPSVQSPTTPLKSTPPAGTIDQAGLSFLERCFLPAASRPTAASLLQDVYLQPIQQRIDEYRRQSVPGGPIYPNPWSNSNGFNTASSSSTTNTMGFGVASPGLNTFLRGGYFSGAGSSVYSVSSNEDGGTNSLSPFHAFAKAASSAGQHSMTLLGNVPSAKYSAT